METIAERLKESREAKGLSKVELTKLAGIKSAVTLTEIESGRTTKSHYIPAIAAALGVDPLWLQTGQGVARPTPGNMQGAASFHISATGTATANLIDPGETYIPVKRVLFKLSAGCTGYEVEPLEGNGPPIFFRRDWLERNNYHSDKLLSVKVNGSSMEPGLYDGDLIVVNTADITPKDGEAFAANYEGELVVKRLARNGGEWWLTSDNSDKRRYPDKLCDEHASLIGRVIYKQSERI